MKKLSLFSAMLCALALAGCSNEETFENAQSFELELTATTDISTRTTVADNSSYQVYWSKTDGFYAYGEQSWGTFTLKDYTSGSTSATFKGIVYGKKNDLQYAVYPSNNYDPANGTITFPTTYTYPDSNAPMVGKINSGKVVFDQLPTGLIRIPVTGLAGKSGQLTLSESNIAGNMTLTVGSDGKATLSGTPTEGTVTINFDASAIGEKETVYFDIPLPPMTHGDITATVQFNDEDIAPVTVTIPGFTAKPGVINANTPAISIEEELTGEITLPTEEENDGKSGELTSEELQALGSEGLADYYNLKLTGDLNGTDIKIIREWAKSSHKGTLDLSEAHIVAGGDSYDGTNYTRNNTIGVSMFAGLDITEFLLPTDIIAIEPSAFYGCNLQNTSIPESVTSIEMEAFYQCGNLNNIIIPRNVTSLGKRAFMNCSSLKEVIILGEIKVINEETFKGCSSLENITLPDCIGYLANGVFYGCQSLKKLTIPSSVYFIGYDLIHGCNNLESVYCYNERAGISLDAYNYDEGGKFYFGSGASNCTLYVPKGTKELYEADSRWTQFKEIVEMGAEEGTPATETAEFLGLWKCIESTFTSADETDDLYGWKVYVVGDAVKFFDGEYSVKGQQSFQDQSGKKCMLGEGGIFSTSRGEVSDPTEIDWNNNVKYYGDYDIEFDYLYTLSGNSLKIEDSDLDCQVGTISIEGDIMTFTYTYQNWNWDTGVMKEEFGPFTSKFQKQ